MDIDNKALFDNEKLCPRCNHRFKQASGVIEGKIKTTRYYCSNCDYVIKERKWD